MASSNEDMELDAADFAELPLTGLPGTKPQVKFANEVGKPLENVRIIPARNNTPVKENTTEAQATAVNKPAEKAPEVQATASNNQVQEQASAINKPVEEKAPEVQAAASNNQVQEQSVTVNKPAEKAPEAQAAASNKQVQEQAVTANKPVEEKAPKRTRGKAKKEVPPSPVENTTNIDSTEINNSNNSIATENREAYNQEVEANTAVEPLQYDESLPTLLRIGNGGKSDETFVINDAIFVSKGKFNLVSSGGQKTLRELYGVFSQEQVIALQLAFGVKSILDTPPIVNDLKFMNEQTCSKDYVPTVLEILETRISTLKSVTSTASPTLKQGMQKVFEKVLKDLITDLEEVEAYPVCPEPIGTPSAAAPSSTGCPCLQDLDLLRDLIFLLVELMGIASPAVKEQLEAIRLNDIIDHLNEDTTPATENLQQAIQMLSKLETLPEEPTDTQTTKVLSEIYTALTKEPAPEDVTLEVVLETIQSFVESCTSNITSAQEEIAKLKREMATESAAGSSPDQEERYKSLMEQKEAAEKKLQEQTETLSRQVADMNASSSLLRGKLQEVETNRNAKAVEIATLKSKLEEAGKEMETAKTKHTEETQTKDSEIQQLQTKIVALEEQIRKAESAAQAEVGESSTQTNEKPTGEFSVQTNEKVVGEQPTQTNEKPTSEFSVQTNEKIVGQQPTQTNVTGTALNALQTQLNALRQEKETLQSELSVLKSSNANRNQSFKELTAQYTSQIESLKEQLAKLEEQKDTAIAERNAEIQTLKAEKANRNAKLAESEKTIANRNAKLANSQTKYESLQASTAEKIRELESAVQTANETLKTKEEVTQSRLTTLLSVLLLDDKLKAAAKEYFETENKSTLNALAAAMESSNKNTKNTKRVMESTKQELCDFYRYFYDVVNIQYRQIKSMLSTYPNFQKDILNIFYKFDVKFSTENADIILKELSLLFQELFSNLEKVQPSTKGFTVAGDYPNVQKMLQYSIEAGKPLTAVDTKGIRNILATLSSFQFLQNMYVIPNPDGSFDFKYGDFQNEFAYYNQNHITPVSILAIKLIQLLHDVLLTKTADLASKCAPPKS